MPLARFGTNCPFHLGLSDFCPKYEKYSCLVASINGYKPQPQIDQVPLNLFKHVLLKLFSAFENAFRGHGSLNRSGLVLNRELGILEEAIHVFGAGANGEDGGELLGSHDFNFKGVVDQSEIEGDSS